MSPFDSIPRANTASSIRGKISSPMPISDDEFPMRNPGEGIATVLGDDGLCVVPQSILAEQQQPPMVPIPFDPGNGTPLLPPRDTSGVGRATLDPTMAASGLRNTQKAHEPHDTKNRGSLSAALHDARTAVPETSLPKKKLTFKSAVKKLFGKKLKDFSANGQSRSLQHRSDPSALRESPAKAPFIPARTTSMPLNEYNRALRSHSPLIGGGMEPQTSDSAGYPLSESTLHSRCTTAPSHVFQRFYQPRYGLAPRPASSSARKRNSAVSTNLMDGDGNAIGTAVSSGNNQNRKSRSLSGLRESQYVSRNRSDEIRFWRESYQGPALSLTTSNKENEAPEVYSPAIETFDYEQQPTKEAVPFNFGPMGEMAGMKITKAANLESRVASLENRHTQMELAISHLNHWRSGNVVRLSDNPKPRTTQDGSPIDRAKSNGSEASILSPGKRVPMYQQQNNPPLDTDSTFSNTFVHPTRPSTPDSLDRPGQQPYSEFSPAPASFVTSTSQIPIPSSSTIASYPSRTTTAQTPVRNYKPYSTSAAGPNRNYPPSPQSQTKNGKSLTTAHHYTALLNLITQEQMARLKLEDQVLNLQHQLHTILSSNIALGPHDPGEDLEDIDSTRHGEREEFDVKEYERQRNLATSRHSTRHEDLERMESDGLGLDGMPKGPSGPPIHVIDRIESLSPGPSRISLHPSAANMTESKRQHSRQTSKFSEASDEMPVEDVFQTPNEVRYEGSKGQTAFDEEISRQTKRNNKARQMSLSRLTMNGAASVAGANF